MSRGSGRKEVFMMRLSTDRVIAAMLCAAVICGLSGCGNLSEDKITGEMSASETNDAVSAGVDENKAVESAQTENPDEDALLYVSIGDSIAHGYGLSNIRDDAYSSVISDLFAADGIKCNAENYGVDGQKSDGLISYIGSNTSLQEDLSEADYVSISIGANNILGTALQFVNDYNDFKTNPKTTFTSEIITEKFKEFNSSTDSGLESLRSDIPVLIETIRSYNDECEIIFLACYNPYGAVHVKMDWGGLMTYDFSALSDTCVVRMDDIIRELSDECGYSVADVYGAFSGKEDKLVNAAPVSDTETFSGGIDPHPNKNGHSVIAGVIYDLVGKK